jgi:small multidrug resistance pump
MNAYACLAIAILAEVIGTTALKASNSFTKLLPSVVVVIGYGISFYFLSLTLRTLPTGIAYAIWSGVGIILISFIGWVVHSQRLDLAAVIGLAFIVTGIAIVNVFSKSFGH